MEDYEKEIEKLKKLLQGCVNELCYRCGDYEKEYAGACDGCRWKGVRHRDYQ